MALFTCEHLGIDIDTNQWVCKIEEQGPSGVGQKTVQLQDQVSGSGVQQINVCKVFKLLGGRWRAKSITRNYNKAVVTNTRFVEYPND